jgi:hypothetical protein
MQDPPTIDELLESASTFLREVAVPQLSGHTAFHARVAANALELVRRELTLGAQSAQAEQASLQSLLGAQGSLIDLNELLCQRIAAGALDLDTPGLAEHLWATTLAKLAIDQPSYAPYRRSLGLK